MTGERVVSRERLLRDAAVWRAAGEGVILIVGSFDLLSAAGARFLEASRQPNHRLVVAVRGDTSSADRWGPGRPVLEAVERARLVAGLRGIDRVVVAEDPDLPILARELEPDLRVEVPGEIENQTFTRVVAIARSAE